VDGNFDRSASVVDGNDFASGTGGVVNNGYWHATAHQNPKRLDYFDEIVSVLKGAGMETCNSGDSSTDDSTPEEKEPEEKEPEKDDTPDVNCPPPGWEECSEQWPPPVDGYCCSASGYLGDTDAHCAHLNAMDECCEKTSTGSLKCLLPAGSCEDPPDVCTGDEGIDAVLKKSNLGCAIGLTKTNPLYTWEGFCQAIR